MLLVWMGILTVSLSGCLAWLGELSPININPNTPGLTGSVVDIDTFIVYPHNPGFELPDLSGDRKAIVALSPIGNRENYKLSISLDKFSTANAAGQSQNSGQIGLDEAEDLSVKSSSNDYFAYTGDAGMIKSEEQAELMNLQGLQAGERLFWVCKKTYSGNVYSQVTAYEAKTGPRMQIYVDVNAVDVNSTQVDKILAEFEIRIYDLLKDYGFGVPYDKDGDGKVTLLITPLTYYGSPIDLIGYFDETNYKDLSYSNNQDMIYLNANVLAQNQMTKIYSNIAHEFQHLLFYSAKLQASSSRFAYDDLWINEGLSVLASTLTCYLQLNNDWRIYDQNRGYFANPARDGLRDWEYDREYSNYGSAGLFAYYLYDHYDNLDIISKIIHADRKIEDEISRVVGVSFDEIVQNWMTANMIDRFANIPDDDYRYLKLSLASAPVYKKLSLLDTLQIRGGGVQYYLIDEEDTDLWFNISSYDGSSIPSINVSVITFR